MVYEYIPNLHPLSGPEGVLVEGGLAGAERRQALESVVRKGLKAGRIEPNDFGLKQMGVDDNQMLYLFDIEQYASLQHK